MPDRSFFQRMAEKTPFGWWSARKPAPGVTVLERQDDFSVRVLTDAPGIHIHYFTTDDDLSRKGWGMVHIVCHDCQQARMVIFPNFDDADIPDDGEGLPTLRAERDRFVAEHRPHGGLYAMGGGRMLCPPHYAVTDTVDLKVQS